MNIRILLYGLSALMLIGCEATPQTETEYTAPESSHATLAGSAWYFGEEDDGSTPYIEFGENGQVNGNGGCNGFSGTYEQPAAIVEGRHTIKFSPLAATKRACIGGAMQIEEDFFNHLSMARSFNIVHGNAVLFYGEDGSKILRLRKSTY